MTSKPRGYSMLLVKRVNALDPALPVARFAKLCIERDWPVTRIATMFGVSRMAVYNWFQGKMVPREDHVAKMLVILEQMTPTQA